MLTQAECLFRKRSPNLTIYLWEEDVGTGGWEMVRGRAGVVEEGFSLKIFDVI